MSGRGVAAAVADIIIYDGVCVLCSRSMRFVAARDRAERFRFVPLQSPYGRQLAGRYGIAVENPQTVVAVSDGVATQRSDAAIAVLLRLPRYGWVRMLRAVPRPVRDALYDLIARHRYAWFGRYDRCPRPPAELAARVIEEVPGAEP